MPGFDRLVFVTAAPAETAAVLRGLGAAGSPDPGRWRIRWVRAGARSRIGVVETGVGKANAAAGTAAAIMADREPVAGWGGLAILNVGIGGTLAAGVDIGSVVVATRSVLADEGVRVPGGFLPCAAIGFPAGAEGTDGVPGDARVLEWLGAVVGEARHGVIATVSACSGVDAGRDDVVARTGAIAEGMEGAAVGVAAAGLGVPFAEARVISNTTGDRGRQVWRVAEALAELERLVRGLGESMA